MPSTGYVVKQEARHVDPVVGGWRFHIAIHPEDTEQAARTLKEILRPTNLKWEYFHFDGGYDPSPNENPGHDPMFSGADEDLRGKEVCVYFPDHVSPDEYKSLILDCWKALQHASVRLWYITPSGNQPILTDTGHPTPFSYASSKPEDGRYGILHETHYNPHSYADPLYGLYIPERDLNGIQYNGIDNVNELVDHLETQIQEAQQHLNGQIIRLAASLEQQTGSESGETLSGEGGPQDIEDRPAEPLAESSIAIIRDYGTLKGKGGIFSRDDSDIIRLVRAYPDLMQIAYRRQVHIIHEKGQLVAARISSTINSEIRRLKGWSPFKASSEHKIYVLECLKKDIYNSCGGTVNDVINGWKSKEHSFFKIGIKEPLTIDAGDIIGKHRNLFFSETRYTSKNGTLVGMKTSTELFIERLQDEFRDASLEDAGEALAEGLGLGSV